MRANVGTKNVIVDRLGLWPSAPGESAPSICLLFERETILLCKSVEEYL
jgi:hypothetical protein